MSKTTRITILFGTIGLYVALSLTTIGQMIFLPVELIVAFLHEFGHATMAVLTGGHVHALQVNPDGSGVTTTSGGSEALILMGGYLGSMFFSNLFVRLSMTDYARVFFVAIAVAAAFSALIWFSTISNFIILALFAGLCFGASKTPAASFFLQFIGVASAVHVLMDFRVGPSSDLAAFEQTVGILPYAGWMYSWLVFAVVITAINIKQILTSERAEE